MKYVYLLPHQHCVAEKFAEYRDRNGGWTRIVCCIWLHGERLGAAEFEAWSSSVFKKDAKKGGEGCKTSCTRFRQCKRAVDDTFSPLLFGPNPFKTSCPTPLTYLNSKPLSHISRSQRSTMRPRRKLSA